MGPSHLPEREETHFRRVHDLPRLLLTPAAGVGAGHLDSWTGQRSPPSLAGFRRASQRGFSLPHSLRPPCTPATAHDSAWRVGSGKIAIAAVLSRSWRLKAARRRRLFLPRPTGLCLELEEIPGNSPGIRYSFARSTLRGKVPGMPVGTLSHSFIFQPYPTCEVYCVLFSALFTPPRSESKLFAETSTHAQNSSFLELLRQYSPAAV